MPQQDLVAETITRRDRLALERLSDVRFVRGQKGLVVEFHFLDNEFFENKVRAEGDRVAAAVSLLSLCLAPRPGVPLPGQQVL